MFYRSSNFYLHYNIFHHTNIHLSNNSFHQYKCYDFRNSVYRIFGHSEYWIVFCRPAYNRPIINYVVYRWLFLVYHILGQAEVNRSLIGKLPLSKDHLLNIKLQATSSHSLPSSGQVLSTSGESSGAIPLGVCSNSRLNSFAQDSESTKTLQKSDSNQNDGRNIIHL